MGVPTVFQKNPPICLSVYVYIDRKRIKLIEDDGSTFVVEVFN
jgi:hypothetical protein